VFALCCYAGNLHGCVIAMHIISRVNATFIGGECRGSRPACQGIVASSLDADMRNW